MENRDDQGKQGRYNLSMSRRTRKPAVIAAKALPNWDGEPGKDADDARRHPSLKDLLKEGGGEERVGCTAKAVEGTVDQEAASREEKHNGGDLPWHKLVQEEKGLQMVRRGSGATDAVKLSGMVSRCAKILNNLVKARPGSKKKAVVRFLK